MSLKPHMEAERLLAAMKRLRTEGRGAPLDLTLYRFANPKYARWPDLVSGMGSKLHGSRWNSPGLTDVLHAAPSPELALAESLAGRRRYRLPVSGAMPLTLRAMACRVGETVDLSDGSVRVAIRVAEERMINTDWERANREGQEALTQAIGRAAWAAGFEGLTVPSAAAPESYNAVIFVKNLAHSSRIEPVDAGGRINARTFT